MNEPVSVEPYTSSVLICRKRFTPSSRTASSSVCVPSTSVLMKSCGPLMERSTWRLGGEVDDGVGAVAAPR